LTVDPEEHIRQNTRLNHFSEGKGIRGKVFKEKYSGNATHLAMSRTAIETQHNGDRRKKFSGKESVVRLRRLHRDEILIGIPAWPKRGGKEKAEGTLPKRNGELISGGKKEISRGKGEKIIPKVH